DTVADCFPQAEARLAHFPKPRFFFSSRRRHTSSVSAFLLNRSSDLGSPFPSQFATRRTLFHVLVGCGLLMLKVSRLKLPVIWLRSEERRVGKECRCRRASEP